MGGLHRTTSDIQTSIISFIIGQSIHKTVFLLHVHPMLINVMCSLRRLPRVFRLSASWALVWCEILNPRDVHTKNINKHGFPVL